jgi:hypothetical protein
MTGTNGVVCPITLEEDECQAGIYRIMQHVMLMSGGETRRVGDTSHLLRPESRPYSVPMCHI